jgi:hypothetical protein
LIPAIFLYALLAWLIRRNKSLAKIPGDQCSDLKNIFAGKIGLKGVIKTASLRKKIDKIIFAKKMAKIACKY